MFYTTQAFQYYNNSLSASTAPAPRPPFPNYKPVSRRRIVRKPRAPPEPKEEEQPEEKKSKSNPVTVKCGELQIGDYKRYHNTVRKCTWINCAGRSASGDDYPCEVLFWEESHCL